MILIVDFGLLENIKLPRFVHHLLSGPADLETFIDLKADKADKADIISLSSIVLNLNSFEERSVFR